MTDSCIILGGGGHASVLIDCIFVRGEVNIFGILDKNLNTNMSVLGIPVLGDDSLLLNLSHDQVKFFVVGVGSIKSLDIRRSLFKRGIETGFEPLNIIHPSSIISKWAELGQGVQLLPGSIINARASIGSNVIINSGAIVEHDCIIGNHSHIAPRATIAGGVNISSGVHIGTGAIIREGIKIGKNVIVGAGSVVIRDIPDDMVVYGVPAKPSI